MLNARWESRREKLASQILDLDADVLSLARALAKSSSKP